MDALALVGCVTGLLTARRADNELREYSTCARSEQHGATPTVLAARSGCCARSLAFW